MNALSGYGRQAGASYDQDMLTNEGGGVADKNAISKFDAWVNE